MTGEPTVPKLEFWTRQVFPAGVKAEVETHGDRVSVCLYGENPNDIARALSSWAWQPMFECDVPAVNL